MKGKTGLHELYSKDPLRADLELFGRKSNALSRRGFLSGLGTMSAILGTEIVFHRWMPAGLIPAALADSHEPFEIEGKQGLTILNDRPLNAETPAHLLNDNVTSARHLFVRNNGIPPGSAGNPNDWKLRISGESVIRPKSYTLAELKDRFSHVALQLVLECGGNGRAEFFPPATGNQWTLGAVGCPQWNGIRLCDVLEDCGIAENAVYIGYH